MRVYSERRLAMLFPIITFIVAIAIAIIAAWFSIAGLMAIFSAAAIPVAIMAGSLEIGKLVSASWVYRNWNRAPFLLKSYLTAATVVLMFITSMGIFGFLSKAHLEQAVQVDQGTAQIEQMTSDIARKEQDIADLTKKSADLQSQTATDNSSIQAQIDAEQTRKDEAYKRIQPAIDEQNAIVDKEQNGSSPQVQAYNSQLEQIDADLTQLQTYVQSNNIVALQAMVGVKADGNFGSQTTSAIEAFKKQKADEKNTILASIAAAPKSGDQSKIDAARAEITRLRSLAEQEVAASQKTIDGLREQLTKTAAVDNSAEIAKVQASIDTKTEELQKMRDDKFALETNVRKLDAEVGPIKYIAELVYGNTEKGTIDIAVRWLIIVFIFVFDPLAVLLLIAANYSIQHIDDDNVQEEIFEVIFSKPDTKSEKELDTEIDISDNEEIVEDIVEENPTTTINKTYAVPEKSAIPKPKKSSGWLDGVKKL